MNIPLIHASSVHRVGGPFDARPVTTNLRRLLILDCVLLLIAGFQLFVLTQHTNRFFAWTISSPLTAAFLGANYWASLPLVYMSSRQRYWSHVRTVIWGVLVFTTLTLVATLLHLDRFHLADPLLSARGAAWAWLAVYLLFPLTLLIITLHQLRLQGEDPARQDPLPQLMRLLMAGQAVVMVVLGVVLFAFPRLPAWPWTLTPLTGRAVGAWLVGIGIISAQVTRENDWERVRVTMPGYALVGALQLVAILRYSDEVAWSRPHAAIYVIVLLSIFGLGCYGTMRSRLITPRR
jgi:hypothetical protein